MREIEGDWCGVSECREVPCSVASHDVNVNSYMPPSHTVYEGVFWWFVVVSHVYLMNNVPYGRSPQYDVCLVMVQL